MVQDTGKETGYSDSRNRRFTVGFARTGREGRVRVLVACEESQVVTQAFIERGHDAMSCDLQPGRKGLPHYQGDVRDLLDKYFDLVIFHPVCKFITNSGVCHLHTEPGRWEKLDQACEFFNLRHRFNSPRVATENPIPHKYAVAKIGKYDQMFQPWHFGHKEMKATCLWLKGLPPLKFTNVVGPPPKEKEQRKYWQTLHRLSPGPDREKLRSVTFQGIAEAMASQWGPGEEITLQTDLFKSA